MAHLYQKGTYNVIDDRTGFKRKNSQCRKEWTGMLVDVSEREPQPQDFVRGVPDNKPVPDARPDSRPRFVGMFGETVRPEDL